MKVKVSKIRDLMISVLKNKGYSDDIIPFIIDMYLGGELRGHTHHGLASFSGFLKHDYSNLEKPKIISETESSVYFDAKSNPGVLIGKELSDTIIKKARKQMVGLALIKNMDSWLRPGAIAEYIADKGFITLVSNSGGGVAIAPPGGYEPVTGTNPIAYGIPTENGSLVVDMATAKKAWGVVREANKYGTNLLNDTFYNANGDITTDPKEAVSVLPFGGYKGFALSLFIEVMCRALIDMPMMIQSNAGSQYGQKLPERGAFIIVIDPSQTTDFASFKKRVSKMLAEINATKPLPNQTIRIPGENAMNEASRAVEKDELDLPDKLWAELKRLI